MYIQRATVITSVKQFCGENVFLFVVFLRSIDDDLEKSTATDVLFSSLLHGIIFICFVLSMLAREVAEISKRFKYPQKIKYYCFTAIDTII